MTVLFFFCLNFNAFSINLVPGYFGYIADIVQVDWNNRQIVQVTRINTYSQVKFSSQMNSTVWVTTRGNLGSGLQQQLVNSSTYG